MKSLQLSVICIMSPLSQFVFHSITLLLFLRPSFACRAQSRTVISQVIISKESNGWLCLELFLLQQRRGVSPSWGDEETKLYHPGPLGSGQRKFKFVQLFYLGVQNLSGLLTLLNISFALCKAYCHSPLSSQSLGKAWVQWFSFSPAHILGH